MNPTPEPTASPAPRHRDGPRFVLVAWAIATAVMIATTAVAAVVVSVIATVRESLGGERSRDALARIAEDALASPGFAWSTVIASQGALLACVWLACRVLRTPALERVGLVGTGLRPVHQAAVLVATVVPFALGLVAASLLSRATGGSSDDELGLQRMWSEGSRGASAAWILVIALLPGFVEEVFYRGFLQRGLLLRWKPAASILTSCLLFAAVHGDLVWAAGIFPLGVWLGVVAWRTGSVLMTFAAHAGVNGLWTAGMMVLHRDPARESLLEGIALVALVLGVVAFPWALAILKRQPAASSSVVVRRPRWILARVAVAAVVVGAFFLVVVPAGVAPAASTQSESRTLPTLGELEAGAVQVVSCGAIGEEGAAEFVLMPGQGTRVLLPANGAGVESVIVTLDASDDTVWLAYAGERSGKGGGRRPRGIVEQLASGDPTVVCMTLTEGPPPVTVRLTLEIEEATKVAVFERARAEGWATRGRR